MANPGLSDDQCREIRDLVEECLRKGGRPLNMAGPGKSAPEMAADEAVRRGIIRSRSAFHGRLKTATLRGYEPDWDLWSPARYTQPVPRAVLEASPAPAPEAFDLSGDGKTCLIIPDLHQDPRFPHRLDVLRWAARLGVDRKIDTVYQLGDWSTWDSVSFHDKNDTQKARLKPPIRDDMDNLLEGIQAFQSEQGSWKPKKKITKGNHEYRLEKFENANPETHRAFTTERDQIFASFGWKMSEYGVVTYCEGVGITHHPVNGMGRAFGGKTGAQRAGNESSCSLIYGHTHHWKFVPAPKLGPTGGVDIMEAGCAMLWGEVEHYALHSLNDWWWGLTIVHLEGGRIRDFERLSMLTLRDKYS